MEYWSKTDLVATSLRREILGGAIPPGTLLRQRDVAERFDVSSTPVREALRRLEAEGFVVTEHHKGASVVRSGESRAEENAAIRAALEPLAARFAATSRSERDLEEIQVCHEQLVRCDDNTRLFALNRAFHLRVYEASSSPVLISMLNLLWRALGEHNLVPRTYEQSIGQHAEILAAIRDQDPDRADRLTREHIAKA